LVHDLMKEIKVMATATVPDGSDTRATREVTAHHTITVEPVDDRHRPDVHQAVVERYRGVVVCICCRDVDLREGASIEDAARSYAAMFEADYVVQVTR
jgi:hypothetical protein